MRHSQQGLTLVELMVGMAIGLLLIAVALLAMSQHLRENHRLLIEARLTQDLHAMMDLLSRDLRRAGPLAVQHDGVRFSHAGSSEPLAYRLHDGIVSTKIGDGHWQAMNDIQSLRVSSLRVVPRTQEIVLDGACREACTGSTPHCPPRQQLRSVEIELTAHAVHDARWTRTTTRHVQLRHDALTGACPT
ncbi:prepilin-type N-terminal cleavage/methylation domain-containing protein [Rhizobacter sp. J219]|uniref:PulJ/GspJ family protein n=1 Tax=Rhizobacter sp. J219 TaxID=2898430 RepID=UPI002151AF8C|nr:prepilin-type N-terminal cleavage/methylation domain-containing protein [Rhizobacter sp. J219]MCR5883350.1 prepilin-type N-terminal cleavage/methylation domain-containing protein [Rhizobacter sp. J219]